MKANVKKIPHQKYYNKNGEVVPGVTTVLNLLSKPNLMDWAWKCGLDGIDYKKERDTKADIGTLAHKIITDHLMGDTTNYDDYTPEEIDKAENCVLSFFEWHKQTELTPIFVEKQLVSEMYQYGGTCDIYGMINGQPVLIDLKTGKAIYEDFKYQLAAYRQLLIDNGYAVDWCMIVRIGREANEGFEALDFDNTTKEHEIFMHTLAIYNLKNKKDKFSEFSDFCKGVTK